MQKQKQFLVQAHASVSPVTINIISLISLTTLAACFFSSCSESLDLSDSESGSLNLVAGVGAATLGSSTLG